MPLDAAISVSKPGLNSAKQAEAQDRAQGSLVGMHAQLLPGTALHQVGPGKQPTAHCTDVNKHDSTALDDTDWCGTTDEC